jgi:hypothetical protein
MVRKLSRRRRDVLDLVGREGSIAPQRVSSLTGMSAGASRKLLYSMVRDQQLVSPERGVYELPEEQTVTSEGAASGQVAGSADAAEDVTGAEKSRIDMPILGESLSGTWAFSVQDGGMVPLELMRQRKGYVS